MNKSNTHFLHKILLALLSLLAVAIAIIILFVNGYFPTGISDKENMITDSRNINQSKSNIDSFKLKNEYFKNVKIKQIAHPDITFEMEELVFLNSIEFLRHRNTIKDLTIFEVLNEITNNGYKIEDLVINTNYEDSKILRLIGYFTKNSKDTIYEAVFRINDSLNIKPYKNNYKDKDLHFHCLNDSIAKVNAFIILDCKNYYLTQSISTPVPPPISVKQIEKW